MRPADGDDIRVHRRPGLRTRLGQLRLDNGYHTGPNRAMDDEPTKEEVDRRAAETLRRMIATPPQPNWKPPKRAKSARSGASKRGKPVRAGEAS
jgi:hypothetical protein